MRGTGAGGVPGRMLSRMLAAGFVLVALAPASAAASLPSVDSGPRPGPDILYAPAPRAPQLENTGVLEGSADPDLGRERLPRRRVPLPGLALRRPWRARDARPRRPAAHGPTRAPPRRAAPTRTRRTRVYAGNAADLVELRVRALRKATAFRVTLNTLKDPERVAFTIAIGGTSGVARALPYGANASVARGPVPDRAWQARRAAPTRDRQRAVGDAAGEARPASGASTRSGRATPTGTRARARCGCRPASGCGTSSTVAIWCPARVRPTTAPGGAGGLARPAAIFNAAFRFQEPFQGPDFTSLTDATWWRDRVQGRALRDGDLGRFNAEVDFGKLRRGRRRRHAGQPRRRAAGRPDEPHPREPLRDRAGHRLLDRLPRRHPAAVVQGRVPRAAAALCDLRAAQAGAGRRLRADAPAALARRHYNQYSTSRNQSQYGERGDGLDRRHAACARAGRLLLRPCRGRRVRGLGRRRAPLSPSIRTGP